MLPSQILLAVTFVPPLFAVYQPLNVYPLRVGVGNEPTAEPDVTVQDEGVTLPPFALNVTTQVVTNTVTVPVVKRTRWGVGIQAGYGISDKGLTPYIGAGLSYNILAW